MCVCRCTFIFSIFKVMYVLGWGKNMYGGVPLLSRHVPIVFRALTSHHAVVAGHAKLEDLCQLWIWELFHLLRDTFIFLFHVWYMGMDHTKDGQLWSILRVCCFWAHPVDRGRCPQTVVCQGMGWKTFLVGFKMLSTRSSPVGWKSQRISLKIANDKHQRRIAFLFSITIFGLLKATTTSYHHGIRHEKTW